MNEKIDWMLGMSENMMNLTVQHMHVAMMSEFYAMTSTIMGNLNHIKLYPTVRLDVIDMMERMMRCMEGVMLNMDVNNDKHKVMLQNMMNFMIIMQMEVIMDAMSKK